MRFDVLTLFPDIFSGYLGQSLLKKAIDRGLVRVCVHDMRQWSGDKHQKVDDRPYGGGPGMVLRVGPVVEGVESVQAEAEVNKLVANLQAVGHRPPQDIRKSPTGFLVEVKTPGGWVHGVDVHPYDMGIEGPEMAHGFKLRQRDIMIEGTPVMQLSETTIRKMVSSSLSVSEAGIYPAAHRMKDIGTGYIYAQHALIPSIKNPFKRAAAQEQFAAYFDHVAEFIHWDDLQPPIIHISQDGTIAWMINQIRLCYRSIDNAETDVTCAWLMVYEKQDGAWVAVANASTFGSAP